VGRRAGHEHRRPITAGEQEAPLRGPRPVGLARVLTGWANPRATRLEPVADTFRTVEFEVHGPKGHSVLSHATAEQSRPGCSKPLQYKGNAAIEGVSESPAPVAQLDRASVFGTDDGAAQLSKPEPDTPSDGAARSACAARRPKNGPQPTDPDSELAKVIDAWATLPKPVKAGILAMVEAAKGSAK